MYWYSMFLLLATLVFCCAVAEHTCEQPSTPRMGGAAWSCAGEMYLPWSTRIDMTCWSTSGSALCTSLPIIHETVVRHTPPILYQRWPGLDRGSIYHPTAPRSCIPVFFFQKRHKCRVFLLTVRHARECLATASDTFSYDSRYASKTTSVSELRGKCFTILVDPTHSSK
jgi:hypothetical protein